MLRNAKLFIRVPRSSESATGISLHALTKMVEPAHRSRLTGEGLNLAGGDLTAIASKPPKGAVVKSPPKIAGTFIQVL